MTLTQEINKPISNVFRRAFIRRRSASTGLYEADWQDISEFVTKWGTIKSSVDEVSLNNFKQSGMNLTVRNDEGKFNIETNPTSLWSGFMTRFRTLVKIEAGYIEKDNTELPVDPIQGIFIMTNDVRISGVKNTAVLGCRSLTSIFDEVLVTDIVGMGATQTASDFITKIRDHTDGSGNFVFQQFISSGAWTIQSTTTNYNAATTTSLDGLTSWEFMNKMAEAEDFILMINRSGGIEFRDRDERTTTSQFSFFGQGFKDQNIIKLEEHREPITKFFTFIRLKWQTGDTSTSYVTAGTTTSVDPTSNIWKYGSRIYEFENEFIPNISTAQAIADNLLSSFANIILEEVRITVKFTPQLEISDKTLLNYHSYSVEDDTLWDTEDWASNAATLPQDGMSWADESGENFDWTNKPFKILSKQLNLDKFMTRFTIKKL